MEIPTDKGIQQLLVYSDSEPVKGQVRVRPSKKIEHLGMKVELIGEIGMFVHYTSFALCSFFLLLFSLPRFLTCRQN